MKTFFRLLVILSLIFVICCRSRTMSRLEIIESVLNSNPDSALTLLESFQGDDQLRPEESAKYHLLLSIALDKNYIDIAKDSLIKNAIIYYDLHGTQKERMLSWYYHGICQKNAGLYSSAIVSFEKAEKYAVKLNDYHYLGLIYRNKGDVFNSCNNYAACVDAHEQSFNYFSLAEEPEFASYAQLALAIGYLNNKDYQKAEEMLKVLTGYNASSVPSDYIRIVAAEVHIAKDIQLDSAIVLFNKARKEYFVPIDYAYMATAYEKIGQRDSADYWLCHAYELARDEADSASFDYMRSLFSRDRGLYKDAFFLMKHATDIQDSLSRVLLKESINGAQRDYYQAEYITQEQANRQLKRSAIYIFVLLILLLSVLILLTVVRHQRERLRIKELMAEIALEKKSNINLNLGNAQLVHSVFSERLMRLDSLSEDYYKADNEKRRIIVYEQFKKLLSEIRKDDTLFSQLEESLNRNCDNIMQKLQDQVPDIIGDNRKLIALFFAQFPYKTILLILAKESLDSLRMAKTRFRKTIMSANAKNEALFLEMLKMKSGRKTKQ